MSNKDNGQLSSLWLPDNPADKIVSAPSVIASLGTLRDRFEVGFNHPAAIPGTVLLLDFTEESTAFAYDKSGLGNDAAGTSIDSALYVDTPFGKAYAFPGATDYFNINDDSINDLTNVTIEVIFKVYNFGSFIRQITQYAAVTDEWGIAIDSSGNLEIHSDIDNAEDHLYLTPINLNQYYHVAAQLTSSLENRLWLNGVLKGTGSLSTAHFDSFAGQTYIGSRNGTPQDLFDGEIVAIRICGRELDPSEFMHHWYMKTMSNGQSGGSSVLFDPEISTFGKKKSHLITVNWKKEEKQEWATLLVNNKKGTPADIILPSVDPTELYLGALPEIDENTIGYWLLDGVLGSDTDGNTGLVKDIIGNGLDGVLTGLTETDLINTKYGRVYDLAGATKYIAMSDDDRLTFVNFSGEMLFRLDTLSADQTLFSKEEGASTREYRVQILSTGTVAVFVFETDTTDYIAFYTDTGIVSAGIYTTLGFAFTENGSNSTIVIVVNGVPYAPAGSETGTYTGMVNLGSELRIGSHVSETDPIDGQIYYLRLSSIARTQDEIIHNALNFHRRANGIIQDAWLT